MTHYERLGVSEEADTEQIVAAFRAYCRRHHPDVDRTEGATERFKEVLRSYKVLRDPAARRAYDLGYDGDIPGIHLEVMKLYGF